MSYCRWSSNDFQCDLYIYSDVNGGWTTHVADCTYSERIPLPLENLNPKDYAEAWEKHFQELDACRITFTQPWAGETFNDDSLAALSERLYIMRLMGYRFPDYVFDRIDEEIKEGVK